MLATIGENDKSSEQLDSGNLPRVTVAYPQERLRCSVPSFGGRYVSKRLVSSFFIKSWVERELRRKEDAQEPLHGSQAGFPLGESPVQELFTQTKEHFQADSFRR